MASVTNQSSPAISGIAITPADGVSLTKGTCRGIYIGIGGNLAVILANDTLPVTFLGVIAGTILPVMAQTVQLTGTTATNLIALY